jgi:hypothetical protein
LNPAGVIAIVGTLLLVEHDKVGPASVLGTFNDRGITTFKKNNKKKKQRELKLSVCPIDFEIAILPLQSLL